eukprot:3058199-Pyramimonas_sp.AAC.1
MVVTVPPPPLFWQKLLVPPPLIQLLPLDGFLRQGAPSPTPPPPMAHLPPGFGSASFCGWNDV